MKVENLDDDAIFHEVDANTATDDEWEELEFDFSTIDLNNDFAPMNIPGFGKGYAGPWPPDAPHRYVFTLYALKVDKLDISPEVDYIEFVKAVLPQTIASATLIGYYGPAKKPLPMG